MVIKPAQLVDEPLELDLEMPEGAIEYTSDVRQVGPLDVDGRAELLVEHRGHKETVEDIRVRAKLAGKFELLCARCLAPVPTPLETDFDLIFRPSSVDAEAGEHAITEDETEIGYYEKSGLPLEDVVREQVLLTLPGRALCRQDCKGLCPHCGADRNAGDCNCGETTGDSRWGALAGLNLTKS
ncbi:MAG: YceD family protein [Janthinobacterium lividum]